MVLRDKVSGVELFRQDVLRGQKHPEAGVVGMGPQDVVLFTGLASQPEAADLAAVVLMVLGRRSWMVKACGGCDRGCSW